MIRRLLLLLGLLLAAPASARPLLILADASVQGALSAAADAWTAAGGDRPAISIGNSAALGARIAALAPADLFISADPAALQAIARRGLLRPGSTGALPMSNRIVLVARGSGRDVFRLVQGREQLPPGRLALAADPYGKPALLALGLWPSVSGRVVAAAHGRDALGLVARGRADLAIVPLTDARSSPRTRIIGIFPLESHPPFRYAVAIPATSSNDDADLFRRFLLSRRGHALFARFGFLARPES